MTPYEALAMPTWRWVPGMLTVSGARVLDVSRGGWLTTAAFVADGDGWTFSYRAACDELPDVKDPATHSIVSMLAQAAEVLP